MSISVNMQTIALNKLADLLGKKGVLPIAANSVDWMGAERRFTVDYRASNVGTIRVIEGRTLRTLAEVSFDFQSDGFRFGPMMNPIASHDYGKERKPGNSPWVCSTPLDALVKVVEYLTVAKVTVAA